MSVVVEAVPVSALRSDRAFVERLRELSLHPRGALTHWLDYAQVDHALVATASLEGALIGWGMAIRQDAPTTVYGLGVFVRPDYRRQGVGRRLLTQLIEQDPTAYYTYSVSSGACAEGLYRALAGERMIRCHA